MYIFLFGADTFRSNDKLNSLKKKFFEKNSSASIPSVLDYNDKKMSSSLAETLSARGLFSEKQLIIMENPITQGTIDQQKEILNFLKANPENEKDQDNVVIFFEKGSPKKNGSLYKYLTTHSQKQEFTPLDGIKLSAWIVNKTKELSPDVTFSKNALDFLIASTGNDLYLLSNEIAKLVNFKNQGEISNNDVAAMVKSKVDSTMFETIEALSSGNKSRALALLHQQLEKGEDVYYILSMYTYQIRTLLKIGDFYWQGITSAPQIAQVSGIHPYVVQKSLYQIRNLSESKTKQMLRDLAEIDSDAKTGKIDPVLALDSFIVSL